MLDHHRIWTVWKPIPWHGRTISAYMGTFDSEAAASAACTSPEHWIVPGELNKKLSEEVEPWPDDVKFPVPLGGPK